MTAQANRRTHTMSADQRREMVRLWADGATAANLGKQFNVHPAYVRKAAVRAGVRRNVARP